MNIKRYIGATFALFAFIFFYEWFVHGFLLMDLYRQTSSVWRNFDQMAADIPFAMLFQLAFAAWTAFAFTQIYKTGGIKNGLLFGLFFGVFAGILSASWYLWLPVPPNLGWSWFASAVVEGLVSGFILGTIYHRD